MSQRHPEDDMRRETATAVETSVAIESTQKSKKKAKAKRIEKEERRLRSTAESLPRVATLAVPKKKAPEDVVFEERGPNTMAKVIAAARAIKRKEAAIEATRRDNEERLRRLEEAKLRWELKRVEEILRENERKRGEKQRRKDIHDSLVAQKILQERAARELRAKELEHLRNESRRKRQLLEAALGKLRQDRDDHLVRLQRQRRVSAAVAVSARPDTLASAAAAPSASARRTSAVVAAAAASPQGKSVFSEMVQRELEEKKAARAAKTEIARNKRDSAAVYGELVRELHRPFPTSTPLSSAPPSPVVPSAKGRVTPPSREHIAPISYRLLVSGCCCYSRPLSSQILTVIATTVRYIQAVHNNWHCG
jgi:hypothetical protein